MEPWEAELIRRQGPGNLVSAARDGRLAIERGAEHCRIDLNWVDEAALALVDAAIKRRVNITFAYPAPAGEVSALLAAQILIREHLLKRPYPTVGIVTASTKKIAETWERLCLAIPAYKVGIAEIFPIYGTNENGEVEVRNKRFSGLVLGKIFNKWPVDVVIMDYLAGPVAGSPGQPTIRIFSDPLDPDLGATDDREEAIWGWSHDVLALWNEEMETSAPKATPFSIAHDRLSNIAHGIRFEIVPCQHEEAETVLERLRNDLVSLAKVAGDSPPRNIQVGLRLAWNAVSTLSAIPCLPKIHDRFAGRPPIAARSTASFENELTAWTDTLDGEFKEIASIIASDVGDLRAALDQGNPMTTYLVGALREDIDTLVVLRTKTACRALSAALGSSTASMEIGKLHLQWMGRLHLEESWPRIVVAGLPPKCAWNLIDSGVSTNVVLLTLGRAEANRAQTALRLLREARTKWSCLRALGRTWRILFSESPPEWPDILPTDAHTSSIVEGPQHVDQNDPFSPLGYLLRDDRPLISDEGLSDRVAEEDGRGAWRSFVDAVEVDTDKGCVLLVRGREIEVLVNGEILDYRPERLKSGMVLLLGRQSGRVGLIAALEEHMKDRPDLIVAKILLEGYQSRVYRAFAESHLSVHALHRRLTEMGCDKTDQAARSWVSENGVMAPREPSDMQRLCEALDIGFTGSQVKETFAGIDRIRIFRRSVGRSLTTAAKRATIYQDQTVVDEATGISIADLREAIVEAKVRSVREIPKAIPISEIGCLSKEPWK